MQDVVFQVCIGGEDKNPFYRYSRLTWEKWCKEKGILFVTVYEKPENLKSLFPKYIRYWMYDILDDRGIEYRKIAYVDTDIMIRWDTPNFFDLSGDRFSAVQDTGDMHYIMRAISLCRIHYPDVEPNYWEYINSGFFVVSNTDECRAVISSVSDFAIRRNDLVRDEAFSTQVSDQTILNFELHKQEVEINYLPFPYNLSHLNQRRIYSNGFFLKYGYLWHFTGDGHSDYREEMMSQVWDLIEPCYEDKERGEELFKEIDPNGDMRIFSNPHEDIV